MRPASIRMGVFGLALGGMLGCCRAPESVSPSRPSAKGVQPYLNMPSDEHGAKPLLLSQTGVFSDTRTLTPSEGLLPYRVNVPFWSDGADKVRWIALPVAAGGGVERVRFSSWGEWRFPRGTVFIKHFISSAKSSPGKRLETRLLVCDKAGGVYGVSYKWRPDQMDAERVDQGHRALVSGGKPSDKPAAHHYFPGPDDCRKCHLAVAGGVLGVSTRQLNCAGAVAKENQLVQWSRLGRLDHPVTEADLPGLPRLPPLDEVGITAQDRARAFLDANCAYCHRPGGAAADFDARWETPLADQGLVAAPARINLGIDRACQIAPKDPWRSTLLARLTTLEQTKMPPLGHEQVNVQGAEILRAWIAVLPGPPVVAPPVIDPKGDDFKEPVRVTIRHSDPAAQIRYTLDGSPPTAASTLYAAPVTLKDSATLRARAFKAGHTFSIVVTDTFIID